MNTVETLLLCTVFSFCTVVAQDEPDAASAFESRQWYADSLEQRADSLQEKANELENQLHAIEQRQPDNDPAIDSQLQDLRTEIEEIHAVIAETAEAIESTQEDIEEYVEEIAKDKKKKKHRGSFIFSLEYSRLAKEPLEDLVGTMNDIDFTLSNRQFITFGFMGYYTNQSNVRLGNGLFAGYKTFQSEPFTTNRYDSSSEETISVDSFVTLRVIPASFAFIGEKAFRYESLNFFAGIMLGGNLTIIVADKSELSNDLFEDTERQSVDKEEWDHEHDKKYPVLLSPAVTWDIHGGIAFAMSENMHVGIDGTLRFTYAYEGFNGVNTPIHSDEFLSVTPGVRLRLTFGNAG